MKARHSVVAGCAIVAVALAANPAAAQQWKPQKNVEIVVAAGAGGSADRGSRVAQKFLAALPDIPSVTVSNRQGGGGTLAWTEDFRNSAEARKHLDAESEFLRKILVEIGVLTR